MGKEMLKRQIYIYLINILLFINFIIIFFGIGDFSSNILTKYVILITTIMIFIFYATTIIFSKKEEDFNTPLFGLANFLTYTPLLFLSTLISIYMNLYFVNPQNYSVNKYSLVTLIVQISVYLPMYLLFYKDSINNQAKNFFKKFPIYIWYIVIFYIIAGLLGGFSEQLFVVNLNVQKVNNNQSIIDGIISLDSNNILYILSVVLIIPIIEEFIYRYLLIEQVILKASKIKLLSSSDFWYSKVSSQKKVYDLCIMLLISFIAGMIFAFVHAMAAENVLIFIQDLVRYSGFAMGISFAYVYTRNIFVTISIHIINNAVSIYFILSTLQK